MKIQQKDEREARQGFAPVLDQESAELAQALRVQAMPAAERGAWLADVWGKVQRSAEAFSANAPNRAPTARSYASFKEKNQFDEARELAFAMHHSIYATQQSPPQK